MKEKYEMRARSYLTPGVPVAIRIDGKAFHTFTKGFKKPFDRVLMTSMQKTMQYLCQNIQGCVFGYTQSDEITLILIDYQTIDTDCWFGYQVQKVCSIAASMATMAFNRFFANEVANEMMEWRCGLTPQSCEIQEREKMYQERLKSAINKGAMFDARCFNIPKEEVANLIYWRQLDATRNSIQMVAQANFSHKELQGQTCNMLQDKLFLEKGINWNNYPADCKRGAACIKEVVEVPCDNDGIALRSRWLIDDIMPIIKGEGRNYVNSRILYFDEIENDALEEDLK
jgi:tRNA(His) 5'-end guanylyltransferase